MPKLLTAGLAALFISTSSLAYAQTPSAATPKGGPSEQDLSALTDTRVELVKIALQMTPEQQKLWPPVEEAIRARSTARHARLAKLAAAANDEKAGGQSRSAWHHAEEARRCLAAFVQQP